jgi:hypothetical protein
MLANGRTLIEKMYVETRTAGPDRVVLVAGPDEGLHQHVDAVDERPGFGSAVVLVVIDHVHRSGVDCGAVRGGAWGREARTAASEGAFSSAIRVEVNPRCRPRVPHDLVLVSAAAGGVGVGTGNRGVRAALVDVVVGEPRDAVQALHDVDLDVDTWRGRDEPECRPVVDFVRTAGQVDRGVDRVAGGRGREGLLSPRVERAGSRSRRVHRQIDVPGTIDRYLARVESGFTGSETRLSRTA